jgi:hypothetical protein
MRSGSDYADQYAMWKPRPQIRPRDEFPTPLFKATVLLLLGVAAALVVYLAVA